MNIVIFYLAKQIVITDSFQNTDNQLIINIDELKKTEILDEFIKFADEPSVNLLTIKTDNIVDGFNKFKKNFKFIYAAGGLIQKDGKYLFIYRLNKWDLPKGKLEMGEEPKEAAIRECEEECGISNLTIINELESTYHIYAYKGTYALKQTFWYSMSTNYQGVLIPQTEEGISNVEWLSLEEIDTKVISNTYPAILKLLKQKG
jgi:8-oxo-dGTP pyrophosphatase MutT (NUDIX family)